MDGKDIPSAPPPLAAPRRPRRPLWTWGLVRRGLANTLAICDEEVFDELFVARRYAWGRVCIISDPDGVRRVLQDNVDNYPRVEPIRRVFEFGSGSGMLAADGELWRRHRRVLNPMLDHRAALADTPMLLRLAQQMAARLATSAGQPFNVGEAFRHLLVRATGEILAGDDRDMDRIVHRMGHYPGKYGFLDFCRLPEALGFVDRWRKSRRVAAQLHGALAEKVEARRNPDYAGKRDLLWRVAQTQDRQSGDALTQPEIEDEILTLGSTSVTALHAYSWFWYLLAMHPWAEARLHAELDAVLGGGPPTAADLPRLTYLRKLVDETMRLYPPLPVMLRRALAEDVVCGRRIRRGAIILVAPWVIHRHRKLWDDPEAFDPERFSPEKTAARSRYAYLPFSLGPHICIGAALAMAETLATLAVLAQRFRFRLVPGAAVEAVAWTNLRPGRGLMMTVEPREIIAAETFRVGNNQAANTTGRDAPTRSA